MEITTFPRLQQRIKSPSGPSPPPTRPMPSHLAAFDCTLSFSFSTSLLPSTPSWRLGWTAVPLPEGFFSGSSTCVSSCHRHIKKITEAAAEHVILKITWLSQWKKYNGVGISDGAAPFMDVTLSIVATIKWSPDMRAYGGSIRISR